MESNIRLDVECEGVIIPAIKDQFNLCFGNWLPGDPADVENFKVFLTSKSRRIDITSFLDEKEIENLKTEFLNEDIE